MSRSLVTSTSALLTHYSFDLQGYGLNQLLEVWLGKYPAKWVIAAVFEALYQGRYKASSVDRILFLWRLKGQPKHHFDYEFIEVVSAGLFQSAPLPSVVLEKVNRKEVPMRARYQDRLRADNRGGLQSHEAPLAA